MANELIINAMPHETRVALLEDKGLAEIYIERTKDRGIAGNIYKGMVVRVLPGMQAAFVDVGLEKAAFLYVSDVHRPLVDLEQLFQNAADAENEQQVVDMVPEPVDTGIKDVLPTPRGYSEERIEDRLQEGQ